MGEQTRIKLTVSRFIQRKTVKVTFQTVIQNNIIKILLADTFRSEINFPFNDFNSTSGKISVFIPLVIYLDK